MVYIMGTSFLSPKSPHNATMQQIYVPTAQVTHTNRSTHTSTDKDTHKQIKAKPSYYLSRVSLNGMPAVKHFSSRPKAFRYNRGAHTRTHTVLTRILHTLCERNNYVYV